VVAHAVRAQSTAPLRVTTAAERAAELDLANAYGIVGPAGAIVRTDTPRFGVELAGNARTWITRLQELPLEATRGLQLDAMGRLYVAADQDEAAQRQFAARLATPGLSLPDRAYTLLLATQLFAGHPHDPARMVIAHRYLTQLDALSVAAVVWKFLGYTAIAEAYDDAGNDSAAAAAFGAAFALVPSIPFAERGQVFLGMPMKELVRFANTLADRADGRAKLDSLGQWLLPLTQASSVQLATDSDYVYESMALKKALLTTLQLTDHLLRPAPPLIATDWFGTTPPAVASPTAPNARARSFDDDRVHVLFFGAIGFGATPGILATLARIHAAFPSVDFWYETHTKGYWGTVTCTPSEEAQHLRHYYVDRQGLPFPTALWAGPKDDTPDGGVLPRDDPNRTAYALSMPLSLVVIDRYGRVRHVLDGTEDGWESRLRRYLRALQSPL